MSHPVPPVPGSLAMSSLCAAAIALAFLGCSDPPPADEADQATEAAAGAALLAGGADGAGLPGDEASDEELIPDVNKHTIRDGPGEVHSEAELREVSGTVTYDGTIEQPVLLVVLNQIEDRELRHVERLGALGPWKTEAPPTEGPVQVRAAVDVNGDGLLGPDDLCSAPASIEVKDRELEGIDLVLERCQEVGVEALKLIQLH